MECPHCNSELEDKGAYGYLASHQSGEILGYIYLCNNSDGFETEEDTLDYIIESESAENHEEARLYLVNEGMTWEEFTCFSSTHYVCGSYYTDNRDHLYEGYPC